MKKMFAVLTVVLSLCACLALSAFADSAEPDANAADKPVTLECIGDPEVDGN